MLNNQQGQNTLQVMFAISILTLVAAVGWTFLTKVQKSTRDAERMANLNKLVKAIDLYYNDLQAWPKGDDDGNGWDSGFYSKEDKRFIQPLVDKGYALLTSTETKFIGDKAMKYAAYPAGYAGCPKEKGPFYVIGIPELESDTRPPQKFTGSSFKCDQRDWQNEFDYVTGRYAGE